VGRAVPGRLADLLGGTGAGGAGALPATAQVCSCHAVTKDTVLTAIGDGCADLPALKACTRAGTGCGSCVPLLRTLLTGAGIAQPKALCEHFDHSRQELFDIIRVRGIRTFTELVAAHGRGRGCDVCKPVVASILIFCHTSLTASVRPKRQQRASTAVWGWGWRSCVTWSSCMAGRLRLIVSAKGGARHSPSVSRSPRRIAKRRRSQKP